MVTSAICLGAVFASLWAEEGRPVVAVFTPGTDLATAVDAAGSGGLRILGYGSVGWVLALEAPDAAARDALRAAGAWALLDAQKAAELCGIRLSTDWG